MGKKRNVGQENPMWRGSKVGYTALHNWAKRRLPKPESCQDCHTATTFLDLANISQQYKRDLSDWEYLCRSCHMAKDGRLTLIQSFNIEKRYPDKKCRVCDKTFHSGDPRAVFCSKPCKGVTMMKAVCSRGHPRTGPNLYVSPRGERHCKKCMALNRMKHRS